jgi:ABC-type branched-subunit amino acid transport system ATPase component
MPNVDGLNPFVIGEPVQSVERFWGRSKQVRYILEQVRNSQCVSLVGPRGYGKTSLLNHVAEPHVRSSCGLRPDASLFVRLEGHDLTERDQAGCLAYFA